MSRDELFAQPCAAPEPFRFDDKVAAVFDDMIRRSIPGYASLIDLCALVAHRYARQGAVVYDLGCSLGTASVAMGQRLPRGCKLVAVDASEPMVQRCRRALAEAALPIEVEVRCERAEATDLSNASLVVMNFTLQFLEPEQRAELVNAIQRALSPGGALLLAEKLRFEDDAERALLEGLHDDFRRHNGYSDLEIAQKRSALERVLRSDTEALHEARLRAAGFPRVACVFRALNFACWLAVK